MFIAINNDATTALLVVHVLQHLDTADATAAANPAFGQIVMSKLNKICKLKQLRKRKLITVTEVTVLCESQQ